MNQDDIVTLVQVIAHYDKRIIDQPTLAVFAESAHRANWSFDDAVEAVHDHNAHSTEYLKPAHITERIRANRRQPAPVAEIEAAPIPKGWGTGRPVQAAYQINGAIGIECAACKAQVGEYCTNPVTEQRSKIPCLSRLAGVATEWPRRA